MLTCAVCGYGLSHVDEACPRCLPGFYSPKPRQRRLLATVVVPDGYASAREFAKDCGVQLVSEETEYAATT